MKILIMGLPGSGKSTLAGPLAKLLGGVWINADDVRTRYDDWDFSIFGRARQSMRMSMLADGAVMADKIAVCDFVCPTHETRELFNADFTVWMDTISESRYADTNKMYMTPDHYDYHVSEWFTDTHEVLHQVVQRYAAVKSGITSNGSCINV